MKREIGPILLALKYANVEALKDLIDNDPFTCLRESLRGSSDPDRIWEYNFILHDKSEVHLNFNSIGFALLADCHHDDNLKQQQILVYLLKQKSFFPLKNDF